MTNRAAEHAKDWGTVIPFAGWQPPYPEVYELYGSEWVKYETPRPVGDIYELLEVYRWRAQMTPEDAPRPLAFAVSTAGWAAPAEHSDPRRTAEPVAPSQSPQRRRVALLCVYSFDGTTASHMKFENEPEDDLIEADSRESGALCDALDECAGQLWGVGFVRGLVLLSAFADEETRQTLAGRVASLMSSLGLDNEDD